MNAADSFASRANELRAVVDGHPEHCAVVVPQLVAMLAEADDADDLMAIAAALNAAWTDEASLALTPYAGHPDPGVRLSVTKSLPSGLSLDESQHRISDVLMRLAEDAEPEIRDWAVFGLGSMLDIDTPALRETLHRHLSDPDANTRLEALVGLAERRDPTVRDLISSELRRVPVERLAVDAARAFADVSLVSPLEELLASGWDEDPELLNRAIATCRSGEQDT